MTRYRPVPRTLSDIMRRLARRPSNAPELMPPERLLAQRAPMADPSQLFQNVSVRPDPDAQTRAQVASEGFKTPEALFGEQRLALPGQPLASPQQLDLLPGLPLPAPILLQPLPEPSPNDAGPEPAPAPDQAGEQGFEPAARRRPRLSAVPTVPEALGSDPDSKREAEDA